MTLEEFDQRVREDWDFCELHDDLRGSIQERDELREQVASLEKRIIHWTAMNALREKGNNRLYQKLEAARAECGRLRAALEKYGQHTERCCIPMVPEGPECTCGLDEALKRAGEARG